MRALILSALLLSPGLPAFSDNERMAVRALDRPFMELIGAIEAPRGYNQITGFTKNNPERPITQMTLKEVMQWQRSIRSEGAKSTAVGKYQFMHDTLEFLIRRYDLNEDDLFDRKMQDYLARIMLNRCGFYDSETEIDELGNCLAGTWAALPMLSGARQGRSRYEGKANNHARTRVEVVRALLSVRFVPEAFSVAARGAEETIPHIEGVLKLDGRTSPILGLRVTDAAFRPNQ